MVIWRYLVLYVRYSDLLVENPDIFYTPQEVGGGVSGDPRRNFSKMFDTNKS